MKNNLLVISDGNGVDNNFKKWPFYLKLLTTKTHNVINKSVVGSSNELMYLQLADQISQTNIDYAIIQWTVPQRIDVIATEFWKEQANKDSVYYFNLINSNSKEWWVTSGSENPYIKDYHERYIPEWHAIQRSQSYMLAAAELLQYYQIRFAFSLCYEFNFSQPIGDMLKQYPWIWHTPNKGLSEFRSQSKYASLDIGLAQPHTLIHLDWLNEILRPQCDFIDFSTETFYNIEQTVKKHV